MSERWKAKLFDLKNGCCNCLLVAACGFIGVGVVQSKAFVQLDRPALGPLACAALCCCIGAGLNRRKIRKYYKIGGNLLCDCLLYIVPFCCCAANQEVQEVLARKLEDRQKAQPVDLGKLSAMMVPLQVSTSPPKAPQKAPSSVYEESNWEEDSYQTISEAVMAAPVMFADNNSSRILISSSEEAEQESIKERLETVETQQEAAELAVHPLDGEDPLIYSHQVGTPPFSYVLGEGYMADAPPPTYMTLEQLKAPKTTDYNIILQGMEMLKEGKLLCVDQEALRKQKGVVKEVIGQVLSNITSGLGAVSVSLPIRIFEPRSSSERMIDRFAFAPTFLNKAAGLTDKVDRMVHLMCTNISGLYLGSRQEKPFNPLLGETYEGRFHDGSHIYVEHTKHNPPTDCFDIIGNGYRLWGYTELDGSFNWNYNELIGEFRGRFSVFFMNDGQLISFNQPKFRICGTLFGDRTLMWEGEFDFKDLANGLYGSIRIGDDKKKWGNKKKMHKANFVGKVWEYDFQNDKPKKVLASVRGSWMKHFTVERGGHKEKLWVLQRDLPHRQFPVDCPLPSDGRYREDLIWLSRGYLEYAAKWKARVEARQRNDRTLRGKH